MSYKRTLFVCLCLSLLAYVQIESYIYLQPNVGNLKMAIVEGFLRFGLISPVLVAFYVVDLYFRKKEKQIKNDPNLNV